jgi:hypothetical protein
MDRFLSSVFSNIPILVRTGRVCGLNSFGHASHGKPAFTAMEKLTRQMLLPSGDPTPSPEDIAVTEQLVQAGKLLDIELVDHLMIGNQR